MTSPRQGYGDTAPTISIVTPCLNARSTIERSLESVAAQRYPGLEHVVIDGQSTDGTLGILKSFASQGAIRLVSEPDGGLAEALNKGVRIAGGDVLGLLNADDLYLPGSLDRVATAFRDHPHSWWVTGRCIIVDAEDREIRRAVTAYKDLLLRHYTYRALLTQCFVSAPSTFIAKRAFERVGLFDESLSYAVDYDLCLRLGRQMPPLILAGDALAAFRMAGDTLSLTGFERQFAEGHDLARRYGHHDRAAVAANALMTKGIVLTYHALRVLRARRRDPSALRR